MTAIEQFLSGLTDERLDRGVRAISWLLGCVYVLGRAWFGSADIEFTVAIEASAIIGLYRGVYVLWMRYASKSHRFHRLHGLITRCRDLAGYPRGQDAEFRVTTFILRDELSCLALGLPRTGVDAALQSLQAYSQEGRWDLANENFAIERYQYTKKDRREAIASIDAGHWETASTGKVDKAKLLNELQIHKSAVVHERVARVVLASVATTTMAVSVFLAGEEISSAVDTLVNDLDITEYLLPLVGVVAGVVYTWAFRRGNLLFSAKRLKREQERQTDIQRDD